MPPFFADVLEALTKKRIARLGKDPLPPTRTMINLRIAEHFLLFSKLADLVAPSESEARFYDGALEAYKFAIAARLAERKYDHEPVAEEIRQFDARADIIAREVTSAVDKKLGLSRAA